MAKEDASASERLWMYMTAIDEAKDAPHENMTKIKNTSVQTPINLLISVGSHEIVDVKSDKMQAVFIWLLLVNPLKGRDVNWLQLAIQI